MTIIRLAPLFFNSTYVNLGCISISPSKARFESRLVKKSSAGTPWRSGQSARALASMSHQGHRGKSGGTGSHVGKKAGQVYPHDRLRPGTRLSAGENPAGRMTAG